MKWGNLLTSAWPLAALIGVLGCSGPHSKRQAVADSREAPETWVPAHPFYITITPELVQEARRDPHGRPADNDGGGHWGAPWEGVLLSIRLQKEIFTNGEPVIACVTLRNASYKVRCFLVSTPHEERDTRIFLTRGSQRILGKDDPKPGRVWSGSQNHEPLSPGTQCQFFCDLTKAFDLTAVGSYSVHAEREVSAYNDVPNRPGYIRGSYTNLLSGTATFRVAEPIGSK